jgi:hypothetical protein
MTASHDHLVPTQGQNHRRIAHHNTYLLKLDSAILGLLLSVGRPVSNYIEIIGQSFPSVLSEIGGVISNPERLGNHLHDANTRCHRNE